MQSWELVTVADIVERAGMTSAAFYYHFSSREELLEEVVEDFANQWVIDDRHHARGGRRSGRGWPGADEVARARSTGRHRSARIFFLSAATAPLLVERCTETRALTWQVRPSCHPRVYPERMRRRAKVNGSAMVVLYEMAVRAHLALDEPYRMLGPRRFRTQLAVLSAMATGESAVDD